MRMISIPGSVTLNELAGYVGNVFEQLEKDIESQANENEDLEKENKQLKAENITLKAMKNMIEADNRNLKRRIESLLTDNQFYREAIRLYKGMDEIERPTRTL